jgi:2'-5' RNA ligase
MSERARLFFALDVPKAATEPLFQLQASLRPLAERFEPRFSRREQMHLTLAFLGDVETSHLDELVRITEDCARHHAAIEARFERVAVFPDPRRARVLVVELEPNPRLTTLATELARAAERFGVPRETRAFRPHLTLARFKKPGNAQFLLDSASVSRTSLRLSALRLYESQRGEYIPHASVSLPG